MKSYLGQKKYEIADHLGNVQATLLDRLTPVKNGAGTRVIGGNADIAAGILNDKSLNVGCQRVYLNCL